MYRKQSARQTKCPADGKTKNLLIDQCTDEIFADESLKTVSRFLYSPRIVDGLNLSVASVKHKLTFVLE